MSGLLEIYRNPPSSEYVTVMEKNGEMKYVSANMAEPFLGNYPDIRVSRDQARIASCRENVKSAFIPQEKTVWQKALHAWYDQGLTSSFEEIVESKEEVNPVAASVVNGILGLLKAFSSLKVSVFPHMSLSNEGIIAKFAEVSDWSESPARAFAWHPHTTKFALALQDDAVHVHTSGNSLVPVLKHKLQKYVSCLAWQPLSASVLAVACESCILIWHVEPTSLAARPSTSLAQVLKHPGHVPVTHLAWDPSGKLLLSSSPTDTAIMVWSVPTEACTPLRRFGGGGISLLSWSPDGSKVLSATLSSMFRVWETTSWNCEVWSQLSGRCIAACWSCDGKMLLFAMEADPVLYCIKFGTLQHDFMLKDSTAAQVKSGSMGSAPMAVAVADLSDVILTSQDGEDVRVGGFVHQMVWNKTSERLAVLCRGPDEEISPFIIIFKTARHPVLQMLPSGFVKGEVGEIPHHIAFQPSFDQGALLSVVWSSGRVGYIPMYFVVEEHISSAQFQHTAVNGHGTQQLYTTPESCTQNVCDHELQFLSKDIVLMR